MTMMSAGAVRWGFLGLMSILGPYGDGPGDAAMNKRVQCVVEDESGRKNGEPVQEIQCAESITVAAPNAEKRRVRVTLSIPAGREAVVIERAPREPKDGEATLEFLEVNSRPVLGPSKLGHVELRQWEGSAIKITLGLQLGRCKKLTLIVREYNRGKNGALTERTVRTKHALPNCCGPRSGRQSSSGRTGKD